MGDIYVKIMTKYYNIKNFSFHFLPLLNSKFHEILLCVVCVCLQLCMHLLCCLVTTACHHVMCHHTLSDWQCQYSGLSPRHHVSTQCHHVNTKACHSFIPPRYHVIKSVLKHDSSEIQEPSKKNVMKAVYAADSLQQTETPQGLFDVMGDTEVI